MLQWSSADCWSSQFRQLGIELEKSNHRLVPHSATFRGNGQIPQLGSKFRVPRNTVVLTCYGPKTLWFHLESLTLTQLSAITNAVRHNQCFHPVLKCSHSLEKEMIILLLTMYPSHSAKSRSQGTDVAGTHVLHYDFLLVCLLSKV